MRILRGRRRIIPCWKGSKTLERTNNYSTAQWLVDVFFFFFFLPLSTSIHRLRVGGRPGLGVLKSFTTLFIYSLKDWSSVFFIFSLSYGGRVCFFPSVPLI